MLRKYEMKKEVLQACNISVMELCVEFCLKDFLEAKKNVIDSVTYARWLRRKKTARRVVFKRTLAKHLQ